MKLWLAIITSGALLTAHTISSSNGIGSKIAEAQANIAERNAERIYAAANGAIGESSLSTTTVRDHVETLKTMMPLGCKDGYLYLDRIRAINPPTLSDLNKNIVITQKINRLCDVSIALPRG